MSERERDITKVCELLARVRIRIGERMEYDVNGRHPVASELTLTLRSIYSASLSSRVLRVKYVHSPFLGCPLYIEPLKLYYSMIYDCSIDSNPPFLFPLHNSNSN